MKVEKKIEGSNIFLKECITEIEKAVDLDSITVERAVRSLFLRCEAVHRPWGLMLHAGKGDSGSGMLSKLGEGYALFRQAKGKRG